MKQTIKELTAVISVAFLLFVAWYGSYLPMRKAQIYIGTLKNMQTNPITSLTDLENRLSVPLNYPSPVGQEELVRNMASSVLGFVQQTNDATSTAQLINFTEKYFDPLIARGKGMSFSQDVYLMGIINEIAYTKTGNPKYLSDAQRYYTEAVEIGPNRPQGLYGLFDVYNIEKNIPAAKAIGEKILHNWPMDKNVAMTMSLLSSATSTATITATTTAK
jgi:hypothetical protein